MAVEAPKKVPYCAGANVVADRVAFSLNVNPIKPECVLVDYPVNSVVAAATKRAASISSRTAITHT